MQKFDCLAASTPVLGPHFLEASAGTGKTFAVEHIVARLLLHESPMELEQILVVTFTRAAARELKLRIRSNIERIARGQLVPWEYLAACKDPSSVRQRMSDALAAFDRCQIYTIHGFCSRMLREFSFEAGIGFTWKESFSSPRLLAALQDFFEMKLSKEVVSPEQLGIVVRWAGSVEELGRKLKKAAKIVPAKFFRDREEEFAALLQSRSPEELISLAQEFEAVKSLYKAEVKGDFKGQIEVLSSFDWEAAFRELIRHKGTLFLYLAPENRKVNAKGSMPHPFFDWGRKTLLPLIESAADPQEIFQQLLAVWKPIEFRIAQEEGILNPDQLLSTMGSAIQQETFRNSVRGKYRAVLIDEFQDTDPIQWDIFQALFLHQVEALYLIGDPKQSIYRFRQADLYTYLKAKETIAPHCHFHLDTNFRSSKELIGALNLLFDREWLKLPKEGRTLPYLPVRAGLDLSTDFKDGKGAIHCLLFQEEISELFPYLVQEIRNLRDQVVSLSSFAVLVKDRYQAAAVQQALAIAGISSMAKSQEPLSETLAFEAMEELFEALREPRHLGKAKVVLAGPFGRYAAEELQRVEESPFVELRAILEEKGWTAACQAFLKMRSKGKTVQENMALQGRSFYADCHQVFEVLLDWERREGFSFEGLGRFFDSLHRMDPEEAPCQRKDSDAEAVQIMTMHVSKGLEFDVVFALGLGTRTPECDVEAEAEKLRQLYVATTRAKRRLYIPIPTSLKKAEMGTHAPIELFCETLGSWKEELRRLSGEASLSIEELPSLVAVTPPFHFTPSLVPPAFQLPSVSPSYLLSFTALAKETSLKPLASIADPQGNYTIHNLPRGPETGVVLHALFEWIYQEKQAWKSPERIQEIVEQDLPALFSPWKKAILQMIEETLTFRLPMGFCLRDVKPGNVLVETEFVFQSQKNFLTGFIDLLFIHEEKVYFVDWKTNWLGEDASHYSEPELKAAIAAHQYDLQARIYREALERVGIETPSAIYFFVRGPQAICFHPEDRHG
ncbi:MAG: UvrD-helicase domain-containing protein [Verrucomicrobiota bacterium]|nr:UvrD-helicase domain-containing protein [Verrucomicrobiota bacterium]